MKTIVITGGSNGLGKAIAKSLAPENRVIILSNDEEELKLAAEECRCDFRICDVTDPGSVEFVINTIVESYQTIDVLINNAGLYDNGPIETADPEKIKQIYQVNAVGPLLITRKVVPHFKERGGGSIINIISVGATYGEKDRSVYYGSKWALRGITESLQVELEPFDIKVIGIYPGLLEAKTKLGEAKQAQQGGMRYENVIEAVKFVMACNDNVVAPHIEVREMKRFSK